MIWRERELYVTPDPQSLRDAEWRANREQRAGSVVVTPARRDHSYFWQQIDAATASSASGRGSHSSLA